MLNNNDSENSGLFMNSKLDHRTSALAKLLLLTRQVIVLKDDAVIGRIVYKVIVHSMIGQV